MTDKTLHLQVTLADNGYIVTTNGRPTQDDPLAQRPRETLIAANKENVLELVRDRIPGGMSPEDMARQFRGQHD